MRLGNTDHVGAHIDRHGFDVSRHGRRIVDSDPASIDLAVRGAVDDVDQKMSAIGKMVRCRDAGQRIFRDRVSIPIEERFAQFATLIFRMGRLVHVDIDMGPNQSYRSAQMRRGKFIVGGAVWQLIPFFCLRHVSLL
jgi:hypothetical protein